MKHSETSSQTVLRIYITLTLLSTFASSFIWGVNTLFLLDAGLSITAAFAANAFFTVGQVLFEVPTGVVADTVGRKASYLLGTVTLLVTTLLYLMLWHIHGPFWAWAIVSALLGLGFTFFSGATEAWLVDALHFTKYEHPLETAFAKGQIASGVAMLVGTISGGVVAQFTNLGVPYILRAAVLGVAALVTALFMKDIGFKPRKSAHVLKEMRSIWNASLDHGFRNPPVRWIMLAAPFGAGVSFYGFYAMQPYLLQLYGKTGSYTIAGLAAAIVAATQIVGGISAPHLHKLFKKRTTVLLVVTLLSALTLALIGLLPHFWVVISLAALWGALFAAAMPVRQTYLNGLIPSAQRATVLSSDNMLSSVGGAVIQPALGKSADIWSYQTSYVIAGGLQVFALPFIMLAKHYRAVSDSITNHKMARKNVASTEVPADPLA